MPDLFRIRSGGERKVFIELRYPAPDYVHPARDELTAEELRWLDEVAVPELRAELAARKLRQAEEEADRPALERMRQRREAERRCLERGARRRSIERRLIAAPPRPGMTKPELRRWAGKRAKEILAQPPALRTFPMGGTHDEQMRLRYARMSLTFLNFEAWREKHGDEDW